MSNCLIAFFLTVRSFILCSGEENPVGMAYSILCSGEENPVGVAYSILSSGEENPVGVAYNILSSGEENPVGVAYNSRGCKPTEPVYTLFIQPEPRRGDILFVNYYLLFVYNPVWFHAQCNARRR